MATIKYQNTKGQWISLYSDAIKNRLRKDKNLSDVPDKALARHNLELDGDNNTTHFHDSHYLPMFQKEAADRAAADKAEATQRANEITTERNAREAAEQAETAARVAGDNNLQTLINKEVNDRTTAITNLRAIVDTKAYFDSQGRLVYPNGDLLWIGG